jgi:hypothetical protein
MGRSTEHLIYRGRAERRLVVAILEAPWPTLTSPGPRSRTGLSGSSSYSVSAEP